jgi:hypothetical protein
MKTLKKYEMVSTPFTLSVSISQYFVFYFSCTSLLASVRVQDNKPKLHKIKLVMVALEIYSK